MLNPTPLCQIMYSSGKLCPVGFLVVGECLYQRLECAFTSPLSTECGMFEMCCMQCCMSMPAVLACVDVLYRGGV